MGLILNRFGYVWSAIQTQNTPKKNPKPSVSLTILGPYAAILVFSFQEYDYKNQEDEKDDAKNDTALGQKN